eukprot:PhF_6_TR31830/c1_g1_i1/m.47082
MFQASNIFSSRTFVLFTLLCVVCPTMISAARSTFNIDPKLSGFVTGTSSVTPPSGATMPPTTIATQPYATADLPTTGQLLPPARDAFRENFPQSTALFTSTENTIYMKAEFDISLVPVRYTVPLFTSSYMANQVTVGTTGVGTTVAPAFGSVFDVGSTNLNSLAITTTSPNPKAFNCRRNANVADYLTKNQLSSTCQSFDGTQLGTTATTSAPARSQTVYPILEYYMCGGDMDQNYGDGKCVFLIVSPYWVMLRTRSIGGLTFTKSNIFPPSSISDAAFLKSWTAATPDSDTASMAQAQQLYNALWPWTSTFATGARNVAASSITFTVEVTNCKSTVTIKKTSTGATLFTFNGDTPTDQYLGTYSVNKHGFNNFYINALSTYGTAAATYQLNYRLAGSQFYLNRLVLTLNSRTIPCAGLICNIPAVPGRVTALTYETNYIKCTNSLGSNPLQFAFSPSVNVLLQAGPPELNSMGTGGYFLQTPNNAEAGTALISDGDDFYLRITIYKPCDLDSTYVDPAFMVLPNDITEPWDFLYLNTFGNLPSGYLADPMNPLKPTLNLRNLFVPLYNSPGNTLKFITESPSCGYSLGSYPLGVRCSANSDCATGRCMELAGASIKVCARNYCYNVDSDGNTEVPSGFTPNSGLASPLDGLAKCPAPNQAQQQCLQLVNNRLCHPTLVQSCTEDGSSNCAEVDPCAIRNSATTCNDGDATTDNDLCQPDGSCVGSYTPKVSAFVPSEVKEGETVTIDITAYITGYVPARAQFFTYSVLTPTVEVVPGKTATASISNGILSVVAPMGQSAVGVPFSVQFLIEYCRTPTTCVYAVNQLTEAPLSASNPASASFTVTDKQFPPSAVDASYTSFMGQPVRQTLGFTDVDGDGAGSMEFSYVQGTGQTSLTTIRLPRGSAKELALPLGSLSVNGNGNFEFYPKHGQTGTQQFQFTVKQIGPNAPTGSSTGTVTLTFTTFQCDSALNCPLADRFAASRYLPQVWENNDGVNAEWDNNAFWISSNGIVGQHYQRVGSFKEIKFSENLQQEWDSKTGDTKGPLQTLNIKPGSTTINPACLNSDLDWLRRFDAEVDGFCASHSTVATQGTWRSDLCTAAPLLGMQDPWMMTLNGCYYTAIRSWTWNQLRTDPNWVVTQIPNTPNYLAKTIFYNQAIQPNSWTETRRGWADQNHKYPIQVTIQGQVEFTDDFELFECDLNWAWVPGQDVGLNLGCFCKLNPTALACASRQQCLSDPSNCGGGVPDPCKDENGGVNFEKCNIPPAECTTQEPNVCQCVASQGTYSADNSVMDMLGLNIYMCRPDQPTQMCAQYSTSQCDKYCGRVQVRVYLSPTLFSETQFFYCFKRTSVSIDGGFSGNLNTCRANPYVNLASISDYSKLCEAKETRTYSPTDISSLFFDIPSVSRDQVKACNVAADYFHPYTGEWVVLTLRDSTGIVANNNRVTTALEYTEHTGTTALTTAWSGKSFDFGFSFRPGVLNLNVKLRVNVTLCVVQGTTEGHHHMGALEETTKKTAFTQDVFISKTFDSKSASAMSNAISASTGDSITSSGTTQSTTSRLKNRTGPTIIIVEEPTPVGVLAAVAAVGAVCIFVIAGVAVLMSRRVQNGMTWSARPSASGDPRSASQVALEFEDK